jgi:hypothetical protein
MVPEELAKAKVDEEEMSTENASSFPSANPIGPPS